MASTGNARAVALGQVVRPHASQPRVKLTARSGRALPGPDQGAERVYRDLVQPGLALVVDHAGRRSYICTGRTTAGRGFRLRIGDALAIDLADARKAARVILGAAACGRDPGAERREQRAARRAAKRPPADDTPAPGPTLQQAVDAFLTASEGRLRSSSWWSYKSSLYRLAVPALGSRAVAEITRQDIDALHAAVTAGSGATCANRLRSVLSAVFSHAERAGLVTGNPCRGSARHRERDRERVLTPAELGRFLEAARARQDPAGTLLQFLLLSAARKGEVLAMTWGDVDLDGATWTKPATSTKRGSAHRVPLAPEAVGILLQLKQFEPGERVFNVSASGLQRRFVETCRVARIEGLRLHDLRRSAASMMAEAGVPLPVVGSLLGHRPGSVITARVYSRATNAGERAGAAALGQLLRAT